MPAPVRRPRSRPASALAALLAVIVLVTGFPVGAYAEPNEIPNAKIAQLRQNLESVAGQFLEAEAAYAKAKKEQVALNQRLAAAENRYARSRSNVAKYAAEAYKSGRLGVLGVMLNATSPDDFLGRSAALERMTALDEARISDLVSARDEITAAKAAVDAAVAEQAKQTREMAKLRKAAEKALSAVGGEATRGWVEPGSPLAIPAPRNSDGTWPKEICSINDPTKPAPACITPRLLHAYEQARKANFKRFTACWRPGDMYEHPKGRACDFAVASGGGFGGTASGDARTYGNRLASFFVKNASRLGVMYVIWFCQVWLPSSGWRRYSPTGSSCGDSPSSDHTDHVHLSVY